MKLNKINESLLPHPKDEIIMGEDGNLIGIQIYAGSESWPNIPKEIGNPNRGSIIIENHGDIWYVTDVESNVKGYGKILYDLAMEYATKKGSGLAPHAAMNSQFAETTESASRIWKYYFEKRDDVKHKILNSDSDEPWLYSVYTIDSNKLDGLDIRNIGPKFFE